MQDLDLFPIPERRIILPVNMKVNYSTHVTLRVEDTEEASADSLVPEMMKVNSGTDLAAMHVADEVCFLLLLLLLLLFFRSLQSIR